MRARLVNFERGLDPKEAMKIGKNRIDAIPWSLNKLDEPEKFKVVEFIPDYKGFPILVYQVLFLATDSFHATSTLPEYSSLFSSPEKAIRAMKRIINNYLITEKKP